MSHFSICILIAMILFTLSAFPIGGKVNLFNLGWAFVMLAVLAKQ